jgi:two-component system, OmpR family, heavy metal sensor histidine kinase CusS
MNWGSITTRLTISFAAILILGFLSLGVYFYIAIDLHFKEIDRISLENAVRRAEHALVTNAAKDPDALKAQFGNLVTGRDRISIRIVMRDGALVAGDASIAFPEDVSRDAMSRAKIDEPVLYTWHDGVRHYRGLALRLPVTNPPETSLEVHAALRIDHHEEFMKVVLRALWIAMGCALAISVLVSILIVRGGLRPLRQLAGQLDAISSKRLDERIASENLPVELIGFAAAFNAMLARLDASFARLSEFSADIAHELRTPVSNLLTQTQVMLSKERSLHEYREVLASNLEELERLGRMVSDMLFLAKTDNTREVVQRERVELANEVRQLFDFYEALAAEKSIELRLDGELSVQVERTMLRRALSNLLSNAIRHTVAGGHVQVSLELADGKAWVHVSNPGAPLSEAAQVKLFERFYRMDAARSRDTEGAGLGLAIVKAIAQAHGGGVGVSSRRGTNIFSIFLPAAATAK